MAVVLRSWRSMRAPHAPHLVKLHEGLHFGVRTHHVQPLQVARVQDFRDFGQCGGADAGYGASLLRRVDAYRPIRQCPHRVLQRLDAHAVLLQHQRGRVRIQQRRQAASDVLVVVHACGCSPRIHQRERWRGWVGRWHQGRAGEIVRRPLPAEGARWPCGHEPRVLPHERPVPVLDGAAGEGTRQWWVTWGCHAPSRVLIPPTVQHPHGGRRHGAVRVRHPGGYGAADGCDINVPVACLRGRVHAVFSHRLPTTTPFNGIALQGCHISMLHLHRG